MKRLLHIIKISVYLFFSITLMTFGIGVIIESYSLKKPKTSDNDDIIILGIIFIFISLILLYYLFNNRKNIFKNRRFSRNYMREVFQPILLNGEIIRHWTIAKSKKKKGLLFLFIFSVFPAIILFFWIKFTIIEKVGPVITAFAMILEMATFLFIFLYFLNKGTAKYGIGLTNQRLILVKYTKNENRIMNYFKDNIRSSGLSFGKSGGLIGILPDIIIQDADQTNKLEINMILNKENLNDGIAIIRVLNNQFYLGGENIFFWAL